VQSLLWSVDGSPLEATLRGPLEAMEDKIKVLMVTPYRQPE
jgi:hypothetical protein